METMTHKVGSTVRTYEVCEVIEASPILAYNLKLNGWEPKTYMLKQTSGRKAGRAHALAQRSMKTGKLEIVALS